MNRRTMLSMCTIGGAGLLLRRSASAAGPAREPAAGAPRTVSIVEYSDEGVRVGVSEVPKVVKSDAEWRKQLSPISYDVTRHEGTERAFTGATWNLHDKGIYRCICCDTALFSSDTKFESGTGWPSFWAPLDKKNVDERSDMSLNMARVAVSCRRCDAHLGHVFDDGPKPTGLRYCMNSASMRFAKATTR